MRTDITNEAPRLRAIDQRAAAIHHRAAQRHEAAVKIQSEAVVFFRSLGQEVRADCAPVTAVLDSPVRESRLAVSRSSDLRAWHFDELALSYDYRSRP
jgi:hypothetical protein